VVKAKKPRKYRQLSFDETLNFAKIGSRASGTSVEDLTILAWIEDSFTTTPGKKGEQTPWQIMKSVYLMYYNNPYYKTKDNLFSWSYICKNPNDTESIRCGAIVAGYHFFSAKKQSHNFKEKFCRYNQGDGGYRNLVESFGGFEEALDYHKEIKSDLHTYLSNAVSYRKKYNQKLKEIQLANSAL